MTLRTAHFVGIGDGSERLLLEAGGAPIDEYAAGKAEVQQPGRVAIEPTTAQPREPGDAVLMARTETFDAALLDVNLDGEMSWEVADVLTARAIPFAFSTGYDQTDMLPERLAGSHILAKPYRLNDVAHRLRQMMAT